MGLAASQARYLSLSARKTNVEYEGQQINHQRLNLSNQSADLFNQMLTMSVPTPPSTTDFTKLQYSWSDGNYTSVIDNFYQIGTPNEEFNYIVSSYHYENVYTGQRKYLSDPQVQATKTNQFSDLATTNYTVKTIAYNPDRDTYTLVMTNALNQEVTSIYKPSDQNTNRDVTEQLDFMYKTDRIAATETDYTKFAYNETTDKITYSGTTYDAVNMNNADEVTKLKQTYGALYDKSKSYYKSSGNQYICKDDVDLVTATKNGSITVRKQDTTTYYTDGQHYVSKAKLNAIKVDDTSLNTLTVSSATNNPIFGDYTSVGNCELKQITADDYETDITIDAVIKQLLRDMGGENGDKLSYDRLKACFDDNGEYINGTLYQFQMAGQTYYTTVDDLNSSLLSAYSEQSVANNGIDSQQDKLSYYNALYIETKVSEVKKALMETDGQGRFSTVKFEDDSVVYTLNVETIKDDEAYDDAMNKYYYEKDQYDKQIADINAKTEVIQAQDRQLQLKLEQLNTEQSALQTEMEACQKVVSKNIEGSFKTFSG
ncbi:MAG: hypothetical protein K6E29_02100 [Cyanobacteria bacterium RUI128]|nr:hypothetical protein [Cyanobacteria bacterium RUI128]